MHITDPSFKLKTKSTAIKSHKNLILIPNLRYHRIQNVNNITNRYQNKTQHTYLLADAIICNIALRVLLALVSFYLFIKSINILIFSFKIS
jgi:hypothetical protein